ncbi:hypothetical protein Acr_23g0004330 [Actinidia rufa]|uniref:Uncharacterized protein n=1 Tax=Actinidia rufa TaxID=165716 RepID=A0A7J0GMU3_9ERIC|nr:hypothetical protein Acr_23g0004330 [Actinidia rufa]
MSRRPEVANSEDLDFLSSWISDHLGKGSSYMTDEVNQSPESPMEGSRIPKVDPLVAIHPLIRLSEEGETIVSAQPSEVAFYETAFPMGLRFPIHPTIRYVLSLSEFRNLFSLDSNPKSDQGRLYFKASYKKTLLEGYLSNVNGSMASGTVGEEHPEEEAPSSSGNAGESHPSYDEHIQRDNHSRDESVEFLGVIRTELRRILPHVPNLTLLRWSAGKVRYPILDPFLNALSSGSDSTSKSQQLAEARAREQQAIDELAKMKVDHDSLTNKLERSGVLVVELREAVDKARSSTMEEFKSSSDIFGAVENAASEYFGEGFNFFKWLLRRHHPNLAINLEGMGLDLDL